MDDRCPFLYCNAFNGNIEKPNAELVEDVHKGQLDRVCRVRALGEIKRGEEIYIDYGSKFWPKQDAESGDESEDGVDADDDLDDDLESQYSATESEDVHSISFVPFSIRVSECVSECVSE
jgi:hypothetical protein